MRMTSAAAFLSARAAKSPPKPPPMMTMRRRLGMGRPMLCACPARVLAHEGRRIVDAAFDRGQYFVRRRGIAKGHRNIAQPAFMADATDRAAGGALEELRCAPAKEQREGRAVEAMGHAKVRARRAVCEFVSG